jgi:hypothetical protein
MPDPGALPPSLESFAYRNGPPLDTLRDFHPHMDRLIRDMDRLLTRPTAPAPAADRPAPEAAPSTKPANPVPKPAASDPPPVQAAGSGAAGIAAPLVAPSPLSAGQAIRRDPPAAKPATAGAPAPVEPFRWLLLLSLALMAIGVLIYFSGVLFGLALGTTFLLTGYYLNMVPWVPISAVLFVLWQWPAVSAAARGPGQGLGRIIAAPFTGMAAARRAGATAAPGSRAMVIAFACLGISGLLYWIFYLGIGNAVIGILRMSLRLIGAVMLGRMILKLRPASRPAR